MNKKFLLIMTLTLLIFITACGSSEEIVDTDDGQAVDRETSGNSQQGDGTDSTTDDLSDTTNTDANGASGGSSGSSGGGSSGGSGGSGGGGSSDDGGSADTSSQAEDCATNQDEDGDGTIGLYGGCSVNNEFYTCGCSEDNVLTSDEYGGFYDFGKTVTTHTFVDGPYVGTQLKVVEYDQEPTSCVDKENNLNDALCSKDEACSSDTHTCVPKEAKPTTDKTNNFITGAVAAVSNSEVDLKRVVRAAQVAGKEEVVISFYTRGRPDRVVETSTVTLGDNVVTSVLEDGTMTLVVEGATMITIDGQGNLNAQEQEPETEVSLERAGCLENYICTQDNGATYVSGTDLDICVDQGTYYYGDSDCEVSEDEQVDEQTVNCMNAAGEADDSLCTGTEYCSVTDAETTTTVDDGATITQITDAIMTCETITDNGNLDVSQVVVLTDENGNTVTVEPNTQLTVKEESSGATTIKDAAGNSVTVPLQGSLQVNPESTLIVDETTGEVGIVEEGRNIVRKGPFTIVTNQGTLTGGIIGSEGEVGYVVIRTENGKVYKRNVGSRTEESVESDSPAISCISAAGEPDDSVCSDTEYCSISNMACEDITTATVLKVSDNFALSDQKGNTIEINQNIEIEVKEDGSGMITLVDQNGNTLVVPRGNPLQSGLSEAAIVIDGNGNTGVVREGENVVLDDAFTIISSGNGNTYSVSGNQEETSGNQIVVTVESGNTLARRRGQNQQEISVFVEEERNGNQVGIQKDSCMNANGNPDDSLCGNNQYCLAKDSSMTCVEEESELGELVPVLGTITVTNPSGKRISISSESKISIEKDGATLILTDDLGGLLEIYEGEELTIDPLVSGSVIVIKDSGEVGLVERETSGFVRGAFVAISESKPYRVEPLEEESDSLEFKTILREHSDELYVRLLGGKEEESSVGGLYVFSSEPECSDGVDNDADLTFDKDNVGGIDYLGACSDGVVFQTCGELTRVRQCKRLCNGLGLEYVPKDPQCTSHEGDEAPELAHFAPTLEEEDNPFKTLISWILTKK
jgi:hypothetical protein